MIAIPELYNLYLENPSICTDSRAVQKGSLFFALKGENFDGNRFAPQALKNGASYAIIDDPKVATSSQYLLVGNVLQALQELATFHRKQLLFPILAITGSNGKTTTKELINKVLESHYRVHATVGNLNNHIGVPLTLLAIPKDAEIAVVEMGANHQGEIEQLCNIAKPTHGIITNIGHAHLEGFGGIEGVKQGKSELYRYLAAHGGVAFVNRDEAHLTSMLSPRQRAVFYQRTESYSPEAMEFQIKLEKSEPTLQVAFWDDFETESVANSNLAGMHNFQNIMTAVAIGQYFKVPETKIADAIEAYWPKDMRSQWLKEKGAEILLDAYNANPSSMTKTLEYFSSLSKPNKVVILGAMKELGPYAKEEHYKIAHLAEASSFEKIVLVGAEFEDAAREIGCLQFEDTESLLGWFQNQDFSGSTLLVKGSRSMKLEKLVQNINFDHA